MTGPSEAASKDVRIRWPRLDSPTRPPVLVYLDFDNWIRFARIRNGQTVPAGYLQLWRAVNAAKSRGVAKFVLSAVHWHEAFAIKDPRQRRDVSAVMGEVTNFASLLSRVVVVQLELDAAMGAALNEPLRWEALPLVGEGFAHAFGINGLRIHDESGADVTEQTHHKFVELGLQNQWNEMLFESEFRVLAGPSDDEAALLRTQGWAPEIPLEGNEQRAQSERDLASRLNADPRWRRGRLRDVITARELAVEWNKQFNEASSGRFEKVDNLLADRNSARALVESMPSARVAVAMKTRYHRNAQHRWTRNDMNDIDALALAVPYCDAVLTDAAARNTLNAARELDCFGTFLPSGPVKCANWLQRLL